MKKNLFFGLLSGLLAGALVLSGCEGPAGSTGGSGSSAPIIVNGTPDIEFVKMLLDAQTGSLPETSERAINSAGLLTEDGISLAVTAGTTIPNQIWFVDATLGGTGTLVLKDKNSIKVVGEGGLKLDDNQVLVLAGGDISGGKIDGATATIVAKDDIYAAYVTGGSKRLTAQDPATTDGTIPDNARNGNDVTLSGNITIKAAGTNPGEINADQIIQTDNVYIIGNLTVSNDVTGSVFLVTGDTVQLDGELTGELDASSAAIGVSADNTKLKELNAKSVSSTGAIKVAGAAKILDSVTVTGTKAFEAGAATIGKPLTIGGDATFGGAVTITGTAEAKFDGKTAITGKFTSAMGTIGKVIFSKDVVFMDAVDNTSGDFIFNSDVTLATEASAITFTAEKTLSLAQEKSILVPGEDAAVFNAAVTAGGSGVTLKLAGGAKLVPGKDMLSVKAAGITINDKSNLVVNKTFVVGNAAVTVDNGATLSAALGGVIEVAGGTGSTLKIENGGTLILTPDEGDNIKDGVLVLKGDSTAGGAVHFGARTSADLTNTTAFQSAKSDGVGVIFAIRPRRLAEDGAIESSNNAVFVNQIFETLSGSAIIFSAAASVDSPANLRMLSGLTSVDSASSASWSAQSTLGLGLSVSVDSSKGAIYASSASS
jgi:hypothetical protein